MEVEDGGESPKGTRPGFRQPASTPPKWTMASKPKMVIGGPVPSWQAPTRWLLGFEQHPTAPKGSKKHPTGIKKGSKKRCHSDRRASRGHNTTTPRMPSRTGSPCIPCAASPRWSSGVACPPGRSLSLGPNTTMTRIAPRPQPPRPLMEPESLI